MINKRCYYEIEQKDKDKLCIVLRGEIDHHSAVSIRKELDALICEGRPKKATLDMSGIDFMDSSGLGLIMGRYALMQKIGGELTLRSPNERLIKIFKLAGLQRIIKIEDGKENEKSNA